MFRKRVVATGVMLSMALITAQAMAQAPSNPWGAEDRHIQNVFGLLERTGASQASGMYDNDELADTTVDLRAYISHRCFEVTNRERRECAQEFGPFADLQETLLDGTLTDLVRRRYPNKAMLREMLATVRSEQRRQKQVSFGISNEEALFLERLTRQQYVWQVCMQRYTNTYGKAAL